MQELAAAGALLAGVLVWLAVERRRLGRARERIPLRIGVTGTRGKSSVVRLIAAALREAGTVTLAKTTGSRPVVILPDGAEREIERPGPASILEQKRLIRLGAELGAEVLVAELMAVRPENLAVESRGILKPRLLVVTNARLDHVEDQGRTLDEIAKSLAASFGAGMTVLIPEDEIRPALREAALASGAALVAVPAAADGLGPAAAPGELEFNANPLLAAAVAARLGIEPGVASRGMAKARPDFGSLRVWRAVRSGEAGDRLLVSAFAANDTDSTRRVVDGLAGTGLVDGRGRIGILNLREDRGDRTLQWLDAVRDGRLSDFDEIVLVGPPARAALRRLSKGRSSAARPRISFSARKDPAGIMASLPAAGDGRSVVVGLGNMGGLGEALVEHWRTIGEPYGA
jgi:poly-gamma-glutamate synthase PgsB/CapB